MMQRVKTADITSGKARLTFTSRSAWLGIQADCQDLRRTHSHLIQGTRPSKKVTNAKDVKRYLNVATIARDGLLVVKRNDPLSPTRECIIVPRNVLDGLVTALHIQLSVTKLLQELGWETLQARRNHKRITTLYKMEHNIIDIPLDQYIIHNTRCSRKHNSQFLQIRHSSNTFGKSFFPNYC